jgi:hypothetical protein
LDSSFRVGSLAKNIVVVTTDSDKHSSLLLLNIINYDRKKFYSTSQESSLLDRVEIASLDRSGTGLAANHFVTSNQTVYPKPVAH